MTPTSLHPASLAGLDAAAWADRLPHRGRMQLLARVEVHDALGLQAQLRPIGDPAEHPLHQRDGDGRAWVPAAAAVEFAAQAMGLHGAASGAGPAPERPGFVAAVRDLRWTRERLDDAPQPLSVRVDLQAGDAAQAVYRFVLRDAAARDCASGRVTVVIDPVAAGLAA